MRTIVALLTLNLILFSCGSTDSNLPIESVDESFIPDISFVPNNDINEVRMSLPKGGTKVIYSFNEPIFESGKKLLNSDNIPFIGINDSSYSLVKIFCAKTSRGKYNNFYLYMKKNNVIVAFEATEIQGLVDRKIVFNGDIHKTLKDKEPQTVLLNTNEKVKKFMTFVSMDNQDEIIKLVIDGNEVSMEFYFNGILERSINGRYINKKLLMDDDYDYNFVNNKLCYNLEGYEYCYTKTDEKSIK
jgi:hypothetical protein